MKRLTAGIAAAGALLVVAGRPADTRVPEQVAMAGEIAVSPALALSDWWLDRSAGNDPVTPATVEATLLDGSPARLTELVQRYCQVCHNDQLLTGNFSLERFDVERADEDPETAEKMILKLRAGMMPPPGIPRPGGDSLTALVETLEEQLDAAARGSPNPGNRTFQRLNRVEYEQSIRRLLDLDIDAGAYLPLDTKSANFDNIADVQMLSPTLLDAYLNAAAEVALLAIGDPDALPKAATYTNPGYVSQWDRIEGAPYGTRGGISATHNFPADGEYVFKMAFEHTTTGGFFGRVSETEQIEVSIDGERVVLLDVDRWMSVSDPNGVTMETEPVFVRAGPHRVTAAFLKLSEGPIEDLMSPHAWSLTDRQIGVSGYGITALAHLKDLVVDGPYDTKGVSDTPSRRRVFSCRPTSADEALPCARRIISEMAPEAYRRPLADREIDALIGFYEEGAAEGGFEIGIRTVLQALLASPDFVFRLEETPVGVGPGESYAIGDMDLASRLSFFLWGEPPDKELMELAGEGELSRPDVLEQQVQRMIADPRSAALGPRFAGQWLRLEDLDKVHPDRLLYPDFHQQLADAMKRETELFFNYLVREDRSVLELYSADYTFVNERLAQHYGMEDVTGNHFRRVRYLDDHRSGILGHGSILTLTSHAGRTSPVLRGKWVMEVLIGTPPPPPPPGVPDLDETEGADGSRVLTTRERMEKHRSNPVCNACHQFMDPIGLSLDNFDVTGRWRIRENGVPLDTQGRLYDGTPIASPAELRQALLKRPTPLIRTFTSNLMAYALGRRIEYFDQPTVRSIAAAAEADDYRMSSFILGIVNSDAFQMKRVPEVVIESSGLH